MPTKDKLQRQIEFALEVIDPWLDHQRFSSRIPGMSVGINRDGNTQH